MTTRAALPGPPERLVQAESRPRLPPSPPVGDNDAGVRPGRVSVGSSPGSGTDVDVWQPASDAASARIPIAHKSDGWMTAVKTCGHSPSGDKFAAETGGA